MRNRKEIEADGTRKDILQLEVLLDIREILGKQIKKSTKREKPRVCEKEVIR